MENNKVKEKLKKKEPVICAFMRIPSPMIAELMAVSGVDLIVIDCEHFQFNVETVANVIRSAALYGASCLVRVSDAANAWMIDNALDMGAAGILLTDSRGVEDVRAAIDALKYYPAGHRGVCTDSRASRYGTALSPRQHPQYFNDNTILAVVIETKAAIAELDEIVKQPEVDILSVGDADLSYEYGRPGETKREDHLALREEIYHKILASGKCALDKTSTAEDMQKAAEEGKNCFYIASDMSLLMQGLRQIIEPFQERQKERE